MGTYKYCLRCGAKLTAGARFCYQCGAAQPAINKPEEPAQAVSIAPAQAESAPVNRTDAIETVRIDPDAPDLKNVRMSDVAPSMCEDAQDSAVHAEPAQAQKATVRREQPHKAQKAPKAAAKRTPKVASAVIALITVAIGAGAWFFLVPRNTAVQPIAPEAASALPALPTTVPQESAEPGVALPMNPQESAQAESSAPQPGESFLSAYTRTHDVSRIRELTIDCAGDGSVIPYNTSLEYADRKQTLNLNDLAQFTSLQTLTIANASTVTMPSQPIAPALETLTISNSGVDANLAGIGNLAGVKTLTVNHTALSDLSEIASTHIEHLTLSENQVTDLYPLQNMTSLQNFYESGENIWDFRGLKNVANVRIEGANAGPFRIATVERDPAARQIQVLASVLNIRTSPDDSSKDNKTGEYALQNGYYYILDEYWDDTSDMTWYKIGASSGTGYWIASKEGDWTKLCE